MLFQASPSFLLSKCNVHRIPLVLVGLLWKKNSEPFPTLAKLAFIFQSHTAKIHIRTPKREPTIRKQGIDGKSLFKVNYTGFPLTIVKHVSSSFVPLLSTDNAERVISVHEQTFALKLPKLCDNTLQRPSNHPGCTTTRASLAVLGASFWQFLRPTTGKLYMQGPYLGSFVHNSVALDNFFPHFQIFKNLQRCGSNPKCQEFFSKLSL